MATLLATANKSRLQSLETQRWHIVLTRRADSSFFYAVLSTGIVCRPGCSSRRPRKENVRFFNTVNEAVDAGFRPCQRCRPTKETQSADVAVAKAMHYLEANLDRTVPLNELARHASTSVAHLHRRFTAINGVSPRRYAQHLRTEQLLRRLPSTSSVTDTIYEAGFSSSSRAHDAATKTGVSISKARAHGKGLTIQYATAPCSLGRVAVAATETGVCSIAFGDNDAELLADLHKRFARAQISASEGRLQKELQAAIATVECGKRYPLPLDLQATAFQMKVWAMLQQIPHGETRTYGQVADGLGMRQSVRAVARACASNPVAVEVPCHRVVGSNGSLTGYRWGLDRKRKLLQREGAL